MYGMVCNFTSHSFILIIKSGQSNLTKSPHRRHTWMVQSYSPGCVNVHPHLTHASLGPPESISQMAFLSVQPFLHSLQQKVPILYNGLHISPSKLPMCMGISPFNTWFLGSTWVHIQYNMSMSSAIFAGLTNVTDRQTDQQTRYSICNNRLRCGLIMQKKTKGAGNDRQFLNLFQQKTFGLG